MIPELSAADRAALETTVRQLEIAWNAMDGAAFGASFAADADFVNIRGEHFRGRAAIAAGHAAIFKTIYAGSTNHYIVEDVPLCVPRWRWCASTPRSRRPRDRSRGVMEPVSRWC